MSASQKKGFTLVEVVVAVAILGAALVSIFAAQGGAIQAGARARRITTASLLARCKMGEIEENVLRDGLPAVSDRGSDGCCEDGEVEGFTCDWSVDRIVLPDSTQLAGEDGEGGQGGILDGLAGAAGGAADSSGGTPGISMEAVLAGAANVNSGDMISQMAMQYVFPILKPQLEEQIRRATVTIRWREGSREESFDIVQFLVATPQPLGGIPGQVGVQGQGGPGQTGTGLTGGGLGGPGGTGFNGQGGR